MSVAEEIERAREKYRQKKIQPSTDQNAAQKRLTQTLGVPARRDKSIISTFGEYLHTYMKVFRKDIRFRLGIQTKSDEEIEQMKMVYNDFMERFG